MPDLTELPVGPEAAKNEHGSQSPALPFPVVGIGASAGGLEAFTQLLSALSVNTGMAFILVQHLDPAHESQLSEILSRKTTMLVRQVTESMAIEPNCVYVIAPNCNVTIAGKALHVTPRSANVLHLPVDLLFHSIAKQQGKLGFAVILSGNGSDGSDGLKAIKSQCGLAFVQLESTAKFASMPRSAIATGVADFVLTPAQIAEELGRISAHPYIRDARQDPSQDLFPARETELTNIFLLIQKSTGVDFSHYKQTTIQRRIERRMIVHRRHSLGEYLSYLDSHPEEIPVLFQELLISVTGFFRDPEAFDALAAFVAAFFRNREPKRYFRVWVPGCATGEEVYSLAICLHEVFEQQGVRPALQLFGTDISELALRTARTGRYPKTIANDVSAERLEQYFYKSRGAYQISQFIRDCCVFAKQDVTHDPPFSRVDLISCRNTLIYFDQSLQKIVLPIFHFSLNEGGLLFLGPAENVSAAVDLFSALDPKNKIYEREISASTRITNLAPRKDALKFPIPIPAPIAADWRKQADRFVQDRYAPDGVIINQDLSVLQIRGKTSYYLESASLSTSQNLLLLTHDSLQMPLREAVLAALAHNKAVSRRGLRLEYQGEPREINLEVIPLSPAAFKERFYFVVFDHVKPPEPDTEADAQFTPNEPESVEQANIRLKHQVAELHEHLHHLAEEHQAALEQQKASNEEISSANEELQSTNEELSTANEEVQSANQELTTVNEELQNRNQELSSLASDLTNLFAAVNHPVLMFDRGLRLRRFTPAAESAFGLTHEDLGRAVVDFRLWKYSPHLDQAVGKVIDSLAVTTREIEDIHGRWWSLTIHPYRTLDRHIEGAVLTFANVDSLKRSLQAAEESRNYAEAIVNTMREPLVVLDAALRIDSANAAFHQTFCFTPEETQGKLIFELDAGQWDLPPFRQFLQRVLTENQSAEDFPTELSSRGAGVRKLVINARRIVYGEADFNKILLAFDEPKTKPARTKNRP